jgi:NADH dehydrogenase [ubiquinone] 1 alpha subcomplex assembly factor 7
MGLQLRVDALKHGSKTEQRERVIEEAAKRLVDSTGMGKEYRVLGITGSDKGQDTWPFMDMQSE